MANIFKLIGRFVAADQEQTIQSKKDATKSFQRRQVLLDCSRYDDITGEKMGDNMPCLEFGGKGLEQLNALLGGGLKKGDLVAVDFLVQGNNYVEDGKTKNFTGIRTLSIERYARNGQQPQQGQQSAQGSTQTQQPAPQPAPQPQGTQQPTASDLPF